MRKWRRPSLAMMALLALLASLVPQLAWACPMSGLIGPAAIVCASPSTVGLNSVAISPCGHMGGKCCKRVSIPPQQSDNEKEHPTLGVAAFPVSFDLAVSVVALEPVAVFQTPAPLELPDLRLWLTRFTSTPPPRLSRYGPAALAGRAPPVA